MSFFNRRGRCVAGTPLAGIYQTGLADIHEKELPMMQTKEIQQRFSQIENTIHHAAQCAQSASGVSMDLKDCVQQLDQKATQARGTRSSSRRTRTSCVSASMTWSRWEIAPRMRARSRPPTWMPNCAMP